MKIKNLPKKYEAIWKKALPILKKGRPGDDWHAKETVEMILNYDGKRKLDKDILIPTAMMHDIGHAAILPEHFRFVTGPEKIHSAKLVHMLTGAKIAKGILESVGYDKRKANEIVEIISTHDFDQLKNVDVKKYYDSENKKIFHDFDAMDRYTETRLQKTAIGYERKDLLVMLEKMLDLFFFDEFKGRAREGLELMKKGIK